MAFNPTQLQIIAAQQGVITRRNAAGQRYNPRHYAGSTRIENDVDSDYGLRLLIDEMPLSRFTNHDREDIWNHAFAYIYTLNGPRTYYQLRDRYNNRNKPGRQHTSERVRILDLLDASAQALGLTIHPTDQFNIIHHIAPGTLTRAGGANAVPANPPPVPANAAPANPQPVRTNPVLPPTIVAQAAVVAARQPGSVPPPVRANPAPINQGMLPRPIPFAAAQPIMAATRSAPVLQRVMVAPRPAVAPQPTVAGPQARPRHLVSAQGIFAPVFNPAHPASAFSQVHQSIPPPSYNAVNPVSWVNNPYLQALARAPGAPQPLYGPRSAQFPTPGLSAMVQPVQNQINALSFGSNIGPSNGPQAPVQLSGNSLNIGGNMLGQGRLQQRVLATSVGVPGSNVKNANMYFDNGAFQLAPQVSFVQHINGPASSAPQSIIADQNRGDNVWDDNEQMGDGEAEETDQPDSGEQEDSDEDADGETDDEDPGLRLEYAPEAPISALPVWAVNMAISIEEALAKEREKPLLTHDKAGGPNRFIIHRLIRADAELKQRLENPESVYDNGEHGTVRPRPDLGQLNQWGATNGPETARSMFHEATFLINGEYDKVIEAANLDETELTEFLSKPVAAEGPFKAEWYDRMMTLDNGETWKPPKKKNLLEQAQALVSANLLAPLNEQAIRSISWLDRLANERDDDDDILDEFGEFEESNEEVKKPESLTAWEKRAGTDWFDMFTIGEIPFGYYEQNGLNPAQAVLACMYCFGHLSVTQTIHELMITEGEIGRVLRYNSSKSDPRTEWINGCWVEALQYVQSERAQAIYRNAVEREQQQVGQKRGRAEDENEEPASGAKRARK